MSKLHCNQCVLVKALICFGKPGMLEQLDQLEQHYFCEFYHVLSFWLFALQQFTLTYCISGLLVLVLSRSRAINFVAEDIDVYL